MYWLKKHIDWTAPSFNSPFKTDGNFNQVWSSSKLYIGVHIIISKYYSCIDALEVHVCLSEQYRPRRQLYPLMGFELPCKVWYLIVSILDLSFLPYFYNHVFAYCNYNIAPIDKQ